MFVLVGDVVGGGGGGAGAAAVQAGCGVARCCPTVKCIVLTPQAESEWSFLLLTPHARLINYDGLARPGRGIMSTHALGPNVSSMTTMAWFHSP